MYLALADLNEIHQDKAAQKALEGSTGARKDGFKTVIRPKLSIFGGRATVRHVFYASNTLFSTF